MPVVSDKCPPAECPVTTILLTSMLYSFALRITHRNAQRQSSPHKVLRPLRGLVIYRQRYLGLTPQALRRRLLRLDFVQTENEPNL